MDANEIYETYRDLPEDEAFEAFEAADVQCDFIERIKPLGKDVADSYLSWMYRNIK